MYIFEPVDAWQVTVLGYLAKQICPKLKVSRHSSGNMGKYLVKSSLSPQNFLAEA